MKTITYILIAVFVAALITGTTYAKHYEYTGYLQGVGNEVTMVFDMDQHNEITNGFMQVHPICDSMLPGGKYKFSGNIQGLSYVGFADTCPAGVEIADHGTMFMGYSSEVGLFVHRISAVVHDALFFPNGGYPNMEDKAFFPDGGYPDSGNILIGEDNWDRQQP